MSRDSRAPVPPRVSTSEQSAHSRPVRFAALRSRNFRNLWLGLVVANAGGQMQYASVAWLVRDLYTEPVYLGLLSLSFAVPMILLTPVGGAVADRVPRLRLVRITQIGFFIQPLIMSVLVLSGVIDIWLILLLRFAYGVLLALDSPVRQALLPDLVERENLSSAVSLSSVAWTGSALVGPAVAGVLLGPIGVGGVLVVTALCALASIAAVFTFTKLPPESHQTHGSVVSGLTEGLGYAVREPAISTLLGLVWAANLLGRSYQALMPIFARDVLGVGAAGYGLLLTAPGAGSMVGGLGLAGARRVRRHDRLLVVGWFGFSITLALFAFSRSLPLSWLLLFLTAGFATLINANLATIFQLRLPANLRGRIMGLVATANIGGSNLGGMGSAALAGIAGAPISVAAGALILVVMGVAVVLPARRKFETSEE